MNRNTLPFRRGIGRREVLRIGALGAGLTLGQCLQFASQSAGGAELAAPKSTRSAIFVFLQGGPSHQDTFDLKPEAAAEYRGEFRPIKTNVGGIEICEHLPMLARCADKYAIVRSVTHNLAAHDLGSRYVLTGNRPIPTLRYPSFGAVASRELESPGDLPAAVAIDEELEGPGYLGTQYGALATGEKPRSGQAFRVRGVSLEESGLSIQHVERRYALARDVDQLLEQLEGVDDQYTSWGRFSRQAHQIITSPRARAAFDLQQESPAVISRFGTGETGQSMLMACRLIEAGVRFVTVLVSGWDTHQNNFKELRERLLPDLDRALSAQLDRLASRGLLDETAVLAVGEFGRTPKVNGQAGRDHWAQAMFALMAGGDVRGGQVLGATDATASRPEGEGYSPDDLAATFYRNIGIDPEKEYQASSGRPIALVRDGRVIRPLLGA
jgi:hypothetical protein